MSVVLSHSKGWILCHWKVLGSFYQGVITTSAKENYNFDEYFDIYQPFKRGIESNVHSKKKRRRPVQLTAEALMLEETFLSIMKVASEEDIFVETSINHTTNDDSRVCANKCFEGIRNVGSTKGSNTNNHPIIARINDDEYIFPAKCTFINDDVSLLGKHLSDSKYDFILLDPPWYNRFVKRRKKYHQEHGYSFLDNNGLSQIPLKALLEESGLVAVWTTNSPTHIEAVKDILFPSWGVKYVSSWFWLKVTKCGELIVPFSSERMKQPYERLMFGCKAERSMKLPEDKRCIVSVPSSVHSHKPPLSEVIKDYLSEESKCLEIFARYLLPGWTSYGNQVLSLQLKSLYKPTRNVQ